MALPFARTINSFAEEVRPMRHILQFFRRIVGFLFKKIGCSFKYKRTTEIEINYRED